MRDYSGLMMDRDLLTVARSLLRSTPSYALAFAEKQEGTTHYKR